MYNGGYPGYAPPPVGYGPPPGSMPTPGAPPYAQQYPPGYGPPPGASPGYGPPPGHGSPVPMQGFQQPPPAFSQPPPFMPPQGPPMGMGGPQRHIGLGAPGAAPNLPAPNAMPSPSAAAGLPPRAQPTGEVYSLFVSSIADGLDDVWLEKVLTVAGPLVNLRRVKDPNGKPKAFGFAEYADPESVLRCLEVVNGAQVPVDSGKGGFKQIKTNADEKTRAKLDAYEKTRIKTDQDTDLDNQARARLDEVLTQLRDPTVIAATISAAQPEIKRPTHLQDLAPEDLPEESRGLITREIQFFRDRAIKRETAKQQEREEKINSGYYSQSSAPAANGPAPPQRQGSYGPPQGGRGGHQRLGADYQHQRGGRPSDPQSYNRPVDFVRAAQQAAAQVTLSGEHGQPLTDAEEDQVRADRKRQMAMAEFRERERRWLGRERARGQALMRDSHRERQTTSVEAERRSAIGERLAMYDDELEQEKGREMFFADRARWRATRAAFREREQREDRMDMEHEQRQIETAKRESEAFLSQQADLFARMAGGKKDGGLLQLDEGTPIKLSFGGTKVAVQQVAPVKKEGVLLSADDDETFKKKRELIPLTYDDLDEEEKGMTEEQKLERRQKKVREIVASIPSDKEALFSKDIRWDKLNDTMVTEKLRPFASKKVVEYLGLQEDELVETVVAHVRAHKGAQALVDELEPVLAEEAEEFTIKFWRMLIFELLAVEARLDTTAS